MSDVRYNLAIQLLLWYSKMFYKKCYEINGEKVEVDEDLHDRLNGLADQLYTTFNHISRMLVKALKSPAQFTCTNVKAT